MFSYRSFLILLVLLGLGPVTSTALYEGQSMDEVVAEMGTPNGKRSSVDREVWVYSGDITLEFIDGRLSRAKGTVMEPVVAAPEPYETAEEVAEPPVKEEIVEQVAAEQPSVEEDAGLDQEIEQFSEGMPELPAELDGFMMEEEEDIPESRGFLVSILLWVIPVFIGFVLLLIAVKIVGVEAAKSALLLIAVADQAVMHGVQWFFLELLGFPSVMHADSLASFIVMLVLVNKLTYAKQLPQAIKVVVISKVAGLVAWYLLVLFVLHNL